MMMTKSMSRINQHTTHTLRSSGPPPRSWPPGKLLRVATPTGRPTRASTDCARWRRLPGRRPRRVARAGRWRCRRNPFPPTLLPLATTLWRPRSLRSAPTHRLSPTTTTPPPHLRVPAVAAVPKRNHARAVVLLHLHAVQRRASCTLQPGCAHPGHRHARPV